MSTLAEYIRWYADLSFYEKPFCEVDNVVLSMLAYYDFNVKHRASVRRACTNTTANDSFLEALCESRRFGSFWTAAGSNAAAGFCPRRTTTSSPA